MANENNELDPKVVERLDVIDWKALEPYGITRALIEKNPYIAKQLAYGQTTGLIRVNSAIFSGEVALRFSPTKENPGRVRIQGIVRAPKPEDDLYFYGQKITSAGAKDALFERISYVNKNGTEYRGVLANANAGRVLSFDFGDGKKDYLVAYNPETHTLEGDRVEDLKKRFIESKGENWKVYGVALTDDQLDDLIHGKTVFHEGKTKEGESFKVVLQYSPVTKDFEEVHPVRMAEVMKDGVDLGLSWKPLSMVIEEKKAEREEKKQSRTAPAIPEAPKQEAGKGKGKKSSGL